MKARQFDMTDLDSKGAGRLVHRDYLAHTLRWAYAERQAFPGARILDVGCGSEAPFGRVLKRVAGRQPELYLGVDIRSTVEPFGSAWVRILAGFDFTCRYAETVAGGLLASGKDTGGRFDLVTCFEVIEHMDVPDGRRLLAGMAAVVKDSVEGGKVLLSTPCFNGKAARNHVHEYTVKELRQLVEEAGFKVVKRFGTFTSWPDLKRVISDEHRRVFEELLCYSSYEVLSNFLAPLYPDAARNNLWELELEVANGQAD